MSGTLSVEADASNETRPRLTVSNLPGRMWSRCRRERVAGLPPTTYHADVEPVLSAHCTQCHRPQGIGPFSLLTYEDARAHADAIVRVTASGEMPPLPPDQSADCPKVEDPRRLEANEISAIASWVGGGTLEGDLSSSPPRSSPSSPLGEPWQVFPMDEEYTSASTSSDDYRCFVIDPHLSENIPVLGLSLLPGNEAIDHHAMFAMVLPENADTVRKLDAADPGPGFSCFGGFGTPDAIPLGGWGPGARPLTPPRPDIGYVLPARTLFLLQMHYNFTNMRGPDRSKIAVYRAPGPPLDIPYGLRILNTSFLIPPGSTDTSATASGRIVKAMSGSAPDETKEGLIYAASGHMHLFGKSITMDIVRRDGSRQCLLHIPQWQFRWQGAYTFATPVSVHDGDRVEARCTWDNSSSNQPLVDGVATKPVLRMFGEKTGDEMCVADILLVRDGARRTTAKACAEKSAAECANCCNDANDGGYSRSIANYVQACGCVDSSPCKSKCESTVCMGKSDVDKSCNACLSGLPKGTACVLANATSCLQNPDCVAASTCLAECPAR